VLGAVLARSQSWPRPRAGQAHLAAAEADGLQKTFHAITLGVSAGDAESSDDGGPAGHMVAGMDDSTGRGRLQAALREALKARDKIAVSALRSALAAIDNAGAVPLGPAPAVGVGSQHVAGAAAGLGAGEGERRRLSDGDVDEIVRAEVAERQAAARDYEQRGHADQADRLRREARVLMTATGTNMGIQASREAEAH